MHDKLRARVLAANLAIVDAGLVTLTFENVSGVDREAGVIAIKPSGIPYEELAADAIVILDLESGDNVSGSLWPSSDAPTHLVLYRAFDTVGGVVHTHSPFTRRLGAGGTRAAVPGHDARRPLPRRGACHGDARRGGDRRRVRGEHRRGDRRGRS
jgi:L-ribulose-5-phosphate 4-epimerase